MPMKHRKSVECDILEKKPQTEKTEGKKGDKEVVIYRRRIKMADTRPTNMQPIESRDLEHATHLRFYRNGDHNFGGRSITWNKKRIPTFDSFLNELTQALKLTNGAVFRVYTPLNGHRVTNFDKLEEGGLYVAAGKEEFKKLKYAEIDPNPRKRSNKVNNNYYVEPVVHSKLRRSGKIKHIKSEGKIINVWPNGDDVNPPKIILLTSWMQNDMDVIQDAITERIRASMTGPVVKLYSKDGTKIKFPDQLEHGGHYIAVPPQQHFKKGIDYREHGAKSIMTTPRLDSKFLPPLSRSTNKSNKGSKFSTPDHSNPTSSYASEKSNNTTSYASRYRRNQQAKKEEDGVFHAKPVAHKRGSQDRARKVDYDKDEGGVFKAKGKNRSTSGAREVEDTADTQTELPIDQREAETVEEEDEGAIKVPSGIELTKLPSEQSSQEEVVTPPTPTEIYPLNSFHEYTYPDEREYDLDYRDSQLTDTQNGGLKGTQLQTKKSVTFSPDVRTKSPDKKRTKKKKSKKGGFFSRRKKQKLDMEDSEDENENAVVPRIFDQKRILSCKNRRNKDRLSKSELKSPSQENKVSFLPEFDVLETGTTKPSSGPTMDASTVEQVAQEEDVKTLATEGLDQVTHDLGNLDSFQAPLDDSEREDKESSSAEEILLSIDDNSETSQAMADEFEERKTHSCLDVGLDPIVVGCLDNMEALQDNREAMEIVQSSQDNSETSQARADHAEERETHSSPEVGLDPNMVGCRDNMEALQDNREEMDDQDVKLDSREEDNNKAYIMDLPVSQGPDGPELDQYTDLEKSLVNPDSDQNNIVDMDQDDIVLENKSLLNNKPNQNNMVDDASKNLPNVVKNIGTDICSETKDVIPKINHVDKALMFKNGQGIHSVCNEEKVKSDISDKKDGGGQISLKANELPLQVGQDKKLLFKGDKASVEDGKMQNESQRPAEFLNLVAPFIGNMKIKDGTMGQKKKKSQIPRLCQDSLDLEALSEDLKTGKPVPTDSTVDEDQHKNNSSGNANPFYPQTHSNRTSTTDLSSNQNINGNNIANQPTNSANSDDQSNTTINQTTSPTDINQDITNQSDVNQGATSPTHVNQDITNQSDVNQLVTSPTDIDQDINNQSDSNQVATSSDVNQDIVGSSNVNQVSTNLADINQFTTSPTGVSQVTASALNQATTNTTQTNPATTGPMNGRGSISPTNADNASENNDRVTLYEIQKLMRAEFELPTVSLYRPIPAGSRLAYRSQIADQTAPSRSNPDQTSFSSSYEYTFEKADRYTVLEGDSPKVYRLFKSKHQFPRPKTVQVRCKKSSLDQLPLPKPKEVVRLSSEMDIINAQIDESLDDSKDWWYISRLDDIDEVLRPNSELSSFHPPPLVFPELSETESETEFSVESVTELSLDTSSSDVDSVDISDTDSSVLEASSELETTGDEGSSEWDNFMIVSSERNYSRLVIPNRDASVFGSSVFETGAEEGLSERETVQEERDPSEWDSSVLGSWETAVKIVSSQWETAVKEGLSHRGTTQKAGPLERKAGLEGFQECHVLMKKPSPDSHWITVVMESSGPNGSNQRASEVLTSRSGKGDLKWVTSFPIKSSDLNIAVLGPWGWKVSATSTSIEESVKLLATLILLEPSDENTEELRPPDKNNEVLESSEWDRTLDGHSSISDVTLVGGRPSGYEVKAEGYSSVSDITLVGRSSGYEATVEESSEGSNLTLERISFESDASSVQFDCLEFGSQDIPANERKSNRGSESSKLEAQEQNSLSFLSRLKGIFFGRKQENDDGPKNKTNNNSNNRTAAKSRNNVSPPKNNQQQKNNKAGVKSRNSNPKDESPRDESPRDNGKKSQEDAAIKIQSQFRGYQTRKQLTQDGVLNQQNGYYVSRSPTPPVEPKPKQQPSKNNRNNIKNSNKPATKATRHTTKSNDKPPTKNGPKSNKTQEPAKNSKSKKGSDDKEVKAATTIQAGFRGYKTRKDLKDKVEEEKAATTIQASFRGKKARSELKQMKSDLEDEATKKYSDEEEKAATKIQAGFRGFKTRRDLAEKEAEDFYTEEEHRAAAKIQSGFRGYKVRRELGRNQKSEYHENESDSEERQKEFARSQARQLYKSTEENALSNINQIEG